MYTFDPTITSLQPALSLLRHDWVNNFFFRTSRHDTLNQLNYALNNPITMTGSLKVSSETQPEANQSKIQSQATFLFAPSFTTGSLTVGFDVTDRTSAVSPFMTEGRHISRAVRDDEQGIFLSVANYPTGLTEIAFCTKITPGCRSMVFIVIKTPAFRYITEKRFDEHIVRNNLVHTLYSLDARTCPSCASDSFLNCTCRLSLARKKHPSDYDSEVRNVDSYVGTFEGFANSRVYEGGHLVSVGNCVSTIHTSVTADIKWKQSLGKWAMRETSESCSLNLVKLSMPNADRGEAFDLDGLRLPETSGFAEGRDDIGLQSLRADDTDLNSYNEVMGLLSAVNSAENEIFSDTSGSEIGASMNGCSEIGQAGNVACSEELTSSEEAVEARSWGDGLNETSRDRAQDEQNGSEAPSRKDSISQEPNTSTERRNGQNQTAVGPSINAHLTRTNEERTCSVVTTRRLTPIAPAIGFRNVRPSTATEELQRKAEVRKARNRASALRSNEKKRIYLNQLKEDIVTAGKTEATLREKEKLLREENLKLRASIYRQGS